LIAGSKFWAGQVGLFVTQHEDRVCVPLAISKHGFAGANPWKPQGKSSRVGGSQFARSVGCRQMLIQNALDADIQFVKSSENLVLPFIKFV
jgi:hypothetical protein